MIEVLMVMRCDTYLHGAPRLWSLGTILVGVKLRCRGFGKFDLRLAPAEGAEMDGLVPLLVTLKDRGERWIQMGIV
jgi:hypothetical protein